MKGWPVPLTIDTTALLGFLLAQGGVEVGSESGTYIHGAYATVDETIVLIGGGGRENLQTIHLVAKRDGQP